MNTYSAKITQEQACQLKALLEVRGYEFYHVEYTLWAARQPDVVVVCYKSLKMVIQGKGTNDFVEFILQPEILKTSGKTTDNAKNVAHIGVDESGKGDYFGPLCIGGVYVNEQIINAWREIGVRDSKEIKNDDDIARIAQRIRTTPGVIQNVVTIGNEAYNRLYSRLKSINRILAWGHARVIENIIPLTARLEIPPQYAISDQFANTEQTIQQALMREGRQLKLVQMHKAENDIAVAAASILARDVFVTNMKKLSTRFCMTLPKGATNVIGAGKEFLKMHGLELLPQVAKLHFRTTYQIQDLPVPERPKWNPADQ